MKAISRFSLRLTIGFALFLIVMPLLAEGAPAKPKPQGTLKIALGSLAEEGFLPDLGDSEQARVWTLVYDYPFYFDLKTRKPIPGLAERFEYSKDGLTLTIYLRKGVLWQGGWGEVTAEDFKYSYERVMRKTSTNMEKEVVANTIGSIEVLSPYSVALRLKKVAPDFWKTVLGMVHSALPIVCKKYVDKVGDEKARDQPIGSGPYRLVEHRPGEYLKFEASDEHWRIVPEYKYLIVQIIPEESTRVAMLKTGETDVTLVSAQKMPDLQKQPGIKVEAFPGGYTLFAGFGGMEPATDRRYKKDYHLKDPWMDIRVREAMNMAIDRDAIVKSIYKGAAKPIAACFTLPGWEKMRPIPYDPERAKKLLAEAGYPNGFNVTVIAAGNWAPSYEIPEVMEIVAAYFEAIGLKVKIDAMDKEELRKLNRAGKCAGAVYPRKETYKDEWAGRHYKFFFPNSDPVLYCDDKIMALVNKYEAEPDPKKREALLGELRDFHSNNKVSIPLVLASPVWAWKADKVGDWPKPPTDKMHFFEYIRYPKPLNTWRSFTP